MKELDRVFLSLEKVGYKIEGIYPKIKVFFDSNIYLTFNFVNFNSCNITYGGQEIVIKKDVDINNVIDIVEKFDDKLEEIKLKIGDIEKIAKKEIKNIINIKDARKKLKLSKIDFSIWLGYQRSFRLVTATRTYTRKESDFIYVPTPRRGVYISHIEPIVN